MGLGNHDIMLNPSVNIYAELTVPGEKGSSDLSGIYINTILVQL